MFTGYTVYGYRSEYKQYVFALLNSVQAKLLPVRIYLTPQRMITTAEDGTTAGREADPKTITEINTTQPTTAKTPTIPGTGLPDTANRLIRLTANTDRQVPTQIGAKARIVQTNAL